MDIKYLAVTGIPSEFKREYEVFPTSRVTELNVASINEWQNACVK